MRRPAPFVCRCRIGDGIVPARPRAAALAAVGTLLIVLVTALAALQLVLVQMWVSTLIVLGLLLVIGLIIPACLLWERSLISGWLDIVLGAYWVGELAFASLLWQVSTGAWFNYAVESVVIACVLTARAWREPLTTRRLGGLSFLRSSLRWQCRPSPSPM